MSAFEMENGLTVITFDGRIQDGLVSDVMGLRDDRMATVLVHGGGQDSEEALEINERIVGELGPERAVSLTLPLAIETSTGGDITVDTNRIMAQLGEGLVPVIPPLAREPGGTRIFPENADTVAGAVATDMQAARLIFAIDRTGVGDQCGKILTELKPDKYKELGRAIKPGIGPKIDAGFEAAKTGVDVTICSFALLGFAARGKNVGTRLNVT